VAAFQLLVQRRASQVVEAELQRFLSPSEAAPIARYLNGNVETIASALTAEGILEGPVAVPRFEMGSL